MGAECLAIRPVVESRDLNSSQREEGIRSCMHSVSGDGMFIGFHVKFTRRARSCFFPGTYCAILEDGK